MNSLYLDIETIPTQRQDVIDEIRAAKKAELDAAIASVRAPSNYGEEVAAKWMAEKGQAQIDALVAKHQNDVEDAYRRTGLDGAFGQVCVIGYAVDDGDPITIYDDKDEARVLRQFNESIELDPYRTTVIGHNVVGFDLRFLVQRYIVNGIRPHPVILRAAQAKPWESEKVYDTMVQWAGLGGRVSLDKLCRALGIESPKGGIDGSKVWDFVQAGEIKEVAEYCKRDVEAVRRVHRRMTFQE